MPSLSDWSKIEVSEEFNSFPAADQKAIKSQWFKRNIAPTPEFSKFKPEEQSKIFSNFLAGPSRTAGDVAKDIGLTVGKGIVDVGSGLVGAADIVSGGWAGKGLSKIGYDPKITQDFLSSGYSEPQQLANQKVENAKGFTNTAKALVQNPSTLGLSVLQSLPSMGLGIGAAQKIRAVAPVVSRLAAGAMGEGAVSSGQAAEAMRQQNPTGLLSAGQTGAAIGTGIGTGIFTVVGGRLANRLGVEDWDTLFLGGKTNKSAANIVARIAGGGVSEGVFEEMPQSMQEQIWMNAATDKPLFEGVPEAGAQGALTGAAMGGGMNIFTRKPTVIDPPPPPVIDDTKSAKDLEAEKTNAFINEAAKNVPLFPETTPEESAAMEAEILRQREEARRPPPPPDPPAWMQRNQDIIDRESQVDPTDLRIQNQREQNQRLIDQQNRQPSPLQQYGLAGPTMFRGKGVDIATQNRELARLQGRNLGLTAPAPTIPAVQPIAPNLGLQQIHPMIEPVPVPLATAPETITQPKKEVIPSGDEEIKTEGQAGSETEIQAESQKEITAKPTPPPAPVTPTGQRQLAGWAWDGNKWRPITGQRAVTRGRNKGKIQVVFPGGKKKVVTQNLVRPAEESEKGGTVAIAQPDVATAKAESTGKKEPWQMTVDEYLEGVTGADEVSIRKIGHVQRVKEAVAQGKPVPQKVLDNYKNNVWAQKAIDSLSEMGTDKAALPKQSKVSTLRGRIKQFGGIAFGKTFAGEVRGFPIAAKMLSNKNGLSVDVAVENLVMEGWLDPGTTVESFLESLRTDKDFVRRGMATREGEQTKKDQYKTDQEKRVEKEMAWEPEEPPDGEYIKVNASDLPDGAKLTIIDGGKSRDGWDVYKIEQGPWETKLVDGTTLELGPGDMVEVLKSDLKKETVDLSKAEQGKLFDEPAPEMFDEPQSMSNPKPKKREKELLALDKVKYQGSTKFEQDKLFLPNQKGLFPTETEEGQELTPKSSNTEDVGQELTANKRNLYKSGLKWSDVKNMDPALKVKEVSKAKVYPRPDYQAMVDSGVSPLIVHLYKQAYDGISSGPSSSSDEALQKYIESVHRVMGVLNSWVEDGRAIAFLQTLGRRAELMVKKTFSISDLAKKEKVESPYEALYPEGWKAMKEEVYALGGNRFLKATQPGTDEAIKAMKDIEKGWPGKVDSWKKQGLQVIKPEAIDVSYYENKRDDTPYVYAHFKVGKKEIKSEFIEGATSKNDQAVVDIVNNFLGENSDKFLLLSKSNRLVGSFATEEEAVTAAEESVKKTRTTIKEEGYSVETAIREGEARRLDGEDISTEKLMTTFGFKGVNFGNWLKGDRNAKERQLHINHAFDSLMDLAEILGVPPKAVSLNGLLGLAIGAQGSGAHAAHFVPGVNEINLTRTAGAGALSHEWAHGLDHYFARLAGLERNATPFLTEHIHGKPSGEIRPEVFDIFKKIVSSMRRRRMTEEEVLKQKDSYQSKRERDVKSWIDLVRKEMLNAIPEEVNVYISVDGKDVLVKDRINDLSDKILNGEYGDGKVIVGPVQKRRDSIQTYLSSNVAELRDLFKMVNKRAYSIDSLKALQSNIDSLEYTKANKNEIENHIPQISTNYERESLKSDKAKGGKPYWSTDLEMFARAFAGYVSDKLDAVRIKNTYLVRPDSQDSQEPKAYVPTGQERKTINDAFDELIKAIETKETDKGTALYQVAYHGTPHVWPPEPGFPHGRPRLDKIGTGEGNQSYGHGFYIGGVKETGTAYTKAGIKRPSFNRTKLKTTDGKAAAIRIKNGEGTAESIISDLEDRITRSDKIHGNDIKKDISTIKWALRFGSLFTEPEGNLYQLDIPDDVLPKLLDWDAPLSEQSEYVKKALSVFGLKQVSPPQGGTAFLVTNGKFKSSVRVWTGEDLYGRIANVLDDKQAASEYLASIGIPGNKYLDGMSRNKGEGSYNYVIWDQDVLDRIALLERNGEKLDAMRETAQYQAAENKPANGGGITLTDVQSLFKGQKVIESGDGTFVVITKGGNSVLIKSVKQISHDEAALEVGLGRKLQGGEALVGGYNGAGFITIHKTLGDKWTLAHESVHWMQDLEIITPQERTLILRKARNADPGSKLSDKEAEAYYVENWLIKRDKIRYAPLRNAMQKIGDFVDAIVNMLGKRTARGVIRDIESGKIFSRGGDAQTMMGEAYEKTAERWYSQMKNVLEKKLPGSGTPADLKKMIQAWANKGEFKAEEMSWSGVNEWLDGKKEGKVSRQEVLDFMDENRVEIQEVEKGFTKQYDNSLEDEAERRLFDGFDWDSWLYDAKREEAEAAWTNPAHIIWLELDRKNYIDEDGDLDDFKTFQSDVMGLKEYDVFSNEQMEEFEREVKDQYLSDSIDQVQRERTEEQEYGAAVEDENPTKFSQYQVPGGENYRELLLTLPEKVQPDSAEIKKLEQARDEYEPDQYMWRQYQNQIETLKSQRVQEKGYRSPHWDEPNVLAHVRFNEQTGPNGERILFLEEVQSDLHQEGRKKGYTSDRNKLIEERKKLGSSQQDVARYNQITNELGKIGNVPDAPFKKAWPLMAFKRMVRYAAENGYASVYWTPGSVHTERWGTERIEWQKQADGSFLIDAKSQSGGVADGIDLETEANIRGLNPKSSKAVNSQKELQDVISPVLTEGQDADGLAKKLWDRMQKEDSGVSMPRKEGFEGFYDKILPAEANKFFGKAAWGSPKVGQTDIETAAPTAMFGNDGVYQKAWSLPITPKMKRKALYEGMPLFQRATKDDINHKIADKFNEFHPGHALKFDGVQEMDPLPYPDKYQFTAYEGPAKGATFLTDSLEMEDIKKKLDEMVGLRTPKDGPQYSVRTPREEGGHKSVFTREFNAITRTLASKLPRNLPALTFMEQVLKSPEYYDHPVIKKIVRTSIDRLSRMYDHFNEINENTDISTPHETVVDAIHAIKTKGISRLKRIAGHVSKEYEQLSEMIDFGDTDGASFTGRTIEERLEKFEQHFRDKGFSEEVISTWKAIRKAYDTSLDKLLAPMRELKEKSMEKAFFRDSSPGLFDKFMSMRNNDGEKQWLSLDEVINEMEQWRGFYAPRLREPGNWVVRASKGPEGFKTYERWHKSSRLQAERMAENLRAKGYSVTVEENTSLGEDVLQHIKAMATAELLDKAAENVAGNENAEAALLFHDELVQQVADLIRARGFRSTMIHRKEGDVIKGYIEDPLERFTLYTSRIAAGLAKAEAASQMTKDFFGEFEDGKRVGGIKADKEPRAYNVGQKYIMEQLRNADATDRFVGIAKSITTFKYLGFSPRAAFVNATSMVTTVPAALRHYTGAKDSFRKVFNELQKAGRDYAHFMATEKQGSLTNEEYRFLLDAKKRHYDDPQYTRDAMGHMSGIYQKGFSRVMDKAMWMFGKTEQWNRGSTMLAAFRMTEGDMMHRENIARTVVEKAHGVYGKATQHIMGMGSNPAAKVVQMMYVYQKFGHNWLQMLHEVGFKDGDIKSFAYGLLSPVILGGAAAIPMKTAIMAIIGALTPGDDRDPEKVIYDSIRKNLGDKGERGVRYGLSGLAGIDLSGSLSFDPTVPTEVKDFSGPIGGVISDISTAGRMLKTGQVGRAAETVLPNAFGNVLKSFREKDEGVRTLRGARVFDEKNKPYRPTGGESTLRAAGFRSSRIATVQARTWEQKKNYQNFKDVRDEIYESYKAYVATRDRSKKARMLGEIKVEIKDYNQNIKKYKLTGKIPLITDKSLKGVLKRMEKPTKAYSLE